MPPRLPGGAIAQGSIFSIFGTRIGPATGVQATSFPLPTTLGGITITVTGSTTVNAIPLYVSDSQINAIMPSNAPVGVASVRVKTVNQQSNAMTVNISPSAFGIFTATGTGLGPGILQNFVSQTNQPINSATIAAQPGQVITLWGTGLGPVSADNVAPTAGNARAGSGACTRVPRHSENAPWRLCVTVGTGTPIVHCVFDVALYDAPSVHALCRELLRLYSEPHAHPTGTARRPELGSDEERSASQSHWEDRAASLPPGDGP